MASFTKSDATAAKYAVNPSLEEKSKGLLNVGQHCAYKECGQVDFLPFICDKCSKSFCLSHQSYASHECDYNVEHQNVMPLCPVCNKYVKVPLNESPDAIVNRHIVEGCQTFLLELSKEEKARLKNSLRCTACPNPNKYSTIVCRDCNNQFCLTHRFGIDHECNKRQQEAREAEQKKQSESFGSRIISASTSLLEKLRLSRGDREKEKAERAAKQSAKRLEKQAAQTNGSATTASSSSASPSPSSSTSASPSSASASTTTATATATTTATTPTDTSPPVPFRLVGPGAASKRVIATGAALSKIRNAAIGDDNIAQDDRMYFTVHFPTADPKGKPLPLKARWPVAFFTSKKATLGKALDVLCRLLGIPNYNHDPKKPRITLARLDAPSLALPFSTTVEELNSLICSGDDIAFVWNVQNDAL